MKLKIFCVFDTAIAAYNRPFFVRSRGEAVRTFSDEVNTADSPMNKHPDHFVLFDLGEYDDQTGKFECGAAGPISCGTALEYMSREDNVVQLKK